MSRLHGRHGPPGTLSELLSGLLQRKRSQTSEAEVSTLAVQRLDPGQLDAHCSMAAASLLGNPQSERVRAGPAEEQVTILLLKARLPGFSSRRMNGVSSGC